MNNIFIEIFSTLPDKRVKRTQKHLFLEIIGLSLFSVLAGAQNYVEIEDFCVYHLDWLKQYFSLPNGIPSHDTFSRVFAAINHQAFQHCFLEWIKSVISLLPEQVIALDGKSIRASRRVKDGLRVQLQVIKSDKLGEVYDAIKQSNWYKNSQKNQDNLKVKAITPNEKLKHYGRKIL